MRVTKFHKSFFTFQNVNALFLKTTYTNTHNALIIIQTLSYMNDCHFNNSKIAPWQLFCNSMWQKYCYL